MPGTLVGGSLKHLGGLETHNKDKKEEPYTYTELVRKSSSSTFVDPGVSVWNNVFLLLLDK